MFFQGVDVKGQLPCHFKSHCFWDQNSRFHFMLLLLYLMVKQ